MKRREFLKSAAAMGTAGAASASVSGCVVTLSRVGENALEDVDIDAFLHEVDTGMDSIGRGSLADAYGVDPSTLSETRRARFHDKEDLARKSLRTLYLVGMFADLPEDEQKHPEVQQRIWQHVPEFAEAIEGAYDVLSELNGEDYAEIRAALERDPDFVMRAAETLSGRGADSDIALRRRLQLRSLMTYISRRVTRQPPELLINEYLDKYDRIRARHAPSPIVVRRVAAKVEEARAAPIAAGAPSAGAPAASASPTLPSIGPTSATSRQRGQRSRERNWTVCLVMLGLGLTLTLIGFGVGIPAGSIGLMVIGTFGAIFLFISFIAMLVQLSR